MILEEEEESAKVYRELKEYEKRGITFRLNDWPASPMQIAQTTGIREDVVYMRDYVLNEQGDIEEVRFNVVKL